LPNTDIGTDRKKNRFRHENQKVKMRRKILIILGISIIFLIALRIALPYALVWYVNRSIQDLPDYQGRVNDIDLHLLRGNFSINDIELVKRGPGMDIPFASIPQVRVSIDWNFLIRGSLIGCVLIESPTVKFVAGAEEAEEQLEISQEWIATSQRLVPLRIDILQITDGTVHYIDPTTDPEVDIYLSDLEVSVRNLANTQELQGPRFAFVEAIAIAMHSGQFRMNMNLDPLSIEPRFEMDAELQNLDLTTLNDFLEAHANFFVDQGTFPMFMEIATEEGHFNGYLRPFFEDVEIGEDPEGGILRSIWESLVDAAGSILESPGEEDQIAARIPLSGELDDPEAGLWQTVFTLLRNGFIEALSRGLEGSIGLEDVIGE
jgi:hypothetical protein